MHIDETNRATVLHKIKSSLCLDELMYISTCNRVEFIFCTETDINHVFVKQLLSALEIDSNSEAFKELSGSCETYSGIDATRHLFEVASSLDSLVVGEREIITQVRNAFEFCFTNGICGDFIRLTIKQTIAAAKQIYTETNIARHPVSVVSLAYHQIKETGLKPNSRVLVIGSGVTNTNLSRFLKKHGLSNFTIFNRTLANAQKLAKELNGDAFELSDIKNYKKGFDVLLVCTGAAGHVVNEDIYTGLLNGETGKKIVIDLSVPNNFDVTLLNKFPVSYLEVSGLEKLASKNLELRKSELEKCNEIIENKVREFNTVYRTRMVEIAMSSVPQKVKEIKNTAINTVFAKEMETLDENSKEVLERIISYIEKKYISVPMMMAKDILLEGKEN